MAYPAAVSEQFPQSFVIDVQNFSSEISGWIRSLVEKNLFCLSPSGIASPSVAYLFGYCLATFSFYQNPENNQAGENIPTVPILMGTAIFLGKVVKA